MACLKTGSLRISLNGKVGMCVPATRNLPLPVDRMLSGITKCENHSFSCIALVFSNLCKLRA